MIVTTSMPKAVASGARWHLIYRHDRTTPIRGAVVGCDASGGVPVMLPDGYDGPPVPPVLLAIESAAMHHQMCGRCDAVALSERLLRADDRVGEANARAADPSCGPIPGPVATWSQITHPGIVAGAGCSIGVGCDPEGLTPVVWNPVTGADTFVLGDLIVMGVLQHASQCERCDLAPLLRAVDSLAPSWLGMADRAGARN